jgi:hypothetical protein
MAMQECGFPSWASEECSDSVDAKRANTEDCLLLYLQAPKRARMDAHPTVTASVHRVGLNAVSLL